MGSAYLKDSEIPITVETRLSDHPLIEAVFRHAAEDYEKALKISISNVNATVETDKSEYKQQNKSQKNIILFNPPFSKTVSTDIGLNVLKIPLPPPKWNEFFNRDLG